MKRENKEKGLRIFFVFVLISFVVPIIYLIIRLIFGTKMFDSGRQDSDYVLMLVQCILGVVSVILPSVIARKFKIKIPVALYVMFLVFLYCAIFLGEVRNFYYVIPHWDDILHAFSSMMTGFTGFIIVYFLNDHKAVKVSMSPLFIAIFAFCFSMTIGAVWEIYEFTFDGILGLNMQKFALEDGTKLLGHDAVTDTMKDIIVDCLGAAISAILGYLSIKKKKGFIHNYYEEKNDFNLPIDKVKKESYNVK